MLSAKTFVELVEAASLAPSADNTQPWEFARGEDAVEVFLARGRALPTDVRGMFGWIGLGAAVENLAIAAARKHLAAAVEYRGGGEAWDPAAVVHLSRGGADDALADWLERRETNRGEYQCSPLAPELMTGLAASVRHLDAGIHWATGSECLERMAAMDASSTFIRLEHKPLHDELFDVLRFSRQEVESTRYGLDFESLGVPFVLVQVARQLRHWSVNQLVSRLGAGRLVAKMLAARLRTAAALCLVTARRPGPAGYLEAGRAMQRLWLAATSRGLAVQPHGVLPQYLTKVEVEPETFLPRHAAALRAQGRPFDELFPAARGEQLAILLRIGRPLTAPARRSVRLRPEQLVREEARRLERVVGGDADAELKGVAHG